MMTETEHLLICLNEECAEIAKRVDKALRFGLDDRDPTFEGAEPERLRIQHEINDLMAVVTILENRGIIGLCADPDRSRAKQAKILKFMEYARDAGALEPQ